MKKKIAIVFPAILIFTVAVFWFFVPKKSEAPVMTDDVSQEMAVPNNDQDMKTESQAPKEKADWLEFKNFKYGYTVKYPRGWFIYNSNLADVFIQPKDEKENEFEPHFMSLEIKTMKVKPSDDVDGLIKAAVKEEMEKGQRTINKEAAKVAGADGYKVMLCGKFECGLYKWFVKNGDNFYYINSKNGWMPQFNQIVANFRFIE